MPAKNYPEGIFCVTQTSGFCSAGHSPTLTFNTADRPHPLPWRQGIPQSSFSLHSCASSCGEYCGEDSIPSSQVFSQSHRLSCRNTKCRLTPCCRHNGCSRALPEPGEVAVISKASTCVSPLSLWGTGRAAPEQGPRGPENKSHKRRVVSATGEKLARQRVLENRLRYLGTVPGLSRYYPV